VTGEAAGVPFIAVAPDGGPRPGAPVVVAWHLMDPPRTEAAFAAALPLDGLDAWRIYLGLPMTGARRPAGGDEEVMRLAFEDAVLNVYRPVTAQAAEEFEPALAALRARLNLGDGPVGLLGGSIGSAVAQLVLAESSVAVSAAALVSPVAQLRPVVDAVGKRYGMTYAWADASLRVADRLDFVERARETARRGEPAVLLVVGEEDDLEGFREPTARLRDALAREYADPSRVELVTVPGMGHPLAEEPGVEPAPQTVHAATVDGHTARWLGRHLTAGR
jgi:dienelactone hydrolase